MVSFDVPVGNVDASLYDAASTMLNNHFADSRRASGFVTSTQQIASNQGVSFPITGVTVLAASQTYAQAYPAQSSSSSSGLSGGAIAGIVIACVVAVALVIGIAWFLTSKGKDKEGVHVEATVVSAHECDKQHASV